MTLQRLVVAALLPLACMGCQVITEEMPTSRTPVTPGGPIPVAITVPTPSNSTPNPAPAPQAPTPTPQAPAPSATPTPAPAPQSPSTPSPVYAVRVGFFGINCGRGVPTPRNGEGILPKGCRGYVTATPKNQDNTDVPPRVHGPDIEWFVLDGDDKIEVQDPTFASDFNKDIVAMKQGNFAVCATVKGTTGCLVATVTPAPR
jgi:hypothetical protein